MTTQTTQATQTAAPSRQVQKVTQTADGQIILLSCGHGIRVETSNLIEPGYVMDCRKCREAAAVPYGSKAHRDGAKIVKAAIKTTALDGRWYAIAGAPGFEIRRYVLTSAMNARMAKRSFEIRNATTREQIADAPSGQGFEESAGLALARLTFKLSPHDVAARSVYCPACRANADEPCRTTAGTPKSDHHQARFDMASRCNRMPVAGAPA